MIPVRMSTSATNGQKSCRAMAWGHVTVARQRQKGLCRSVVDERHGPRQRGGVAGFAECAMWFACAASRFACPSPHEAAFEAQWLRPTVRVKTVSVLAGKRRISVIRDKNNENKDLGGLEGAQDNKESYQFSHMN